MPKREQRQALRLGDEEARRRIEECRRRGHTDLSLSGLNLTTLPPEIGRLEELEVLVLPTNELADLPPEFANLLRLASLFLEHHAMKGNPLRALPKAVCKLQRSEKCCLTNIAEQRHSGMKS